MCEGGAEFKMAVSIPGVVISSLMFEMKNSQRDTVGLLLGDTLRYCVSAISDTESSGTREEKRICVQEYVVVGTVRSFTDARGRVDFNRLDELVDGRLKSIVGWFKYRCNSSHKLSLLEKTVHRWLMQGLPCSPGKDMVFGLFTESTPEDPGLHTLEHSFSRWVGSCPEPVHVDVVNLKSTSTMPYHFSPVAPVPSSMETYHNLFNHNRYGLLTASGDSMHSMAMEELCKGLQEKFDPLQVELRKSFDTIQALQQDISITQKKLEQLKAANARKETTGVIGGCSDNVPPLISFNDGDADDFSNLANGITPAPEAAKPLLTPQLEPLTPEVAKPLLTPQPLEPLTPEGAKPFLTPQPLEPLTPEVAKPLLTPQSLEPDLVISNTAVDDEDTISV